MFGFNDIYKNFMEASTHIMKRNDSYTHAKRQIDFLYPKLREKLLTEDDEELLDRIITCYDVQLAEKTKSSFQSGFKSGLLMAVQVLNND